MEVAEGRTREPVGGPPDDARVPQLERHRSIIVLLLAALVLFTARIGHLSLPSLEDAFYAREAVEMARRGRAHTVTWNGMPTHQHPPLHLWLVARTFVALGERNLAAGLPTVLLALGILALALRIGVLTVGRPWARRTRSSRKDATGSSFGSPPESAPAGDGGPPRAQRRSRQ
jgi:hypothetical protein